ncbi:MAG TPA: alpha/beta fold hydrolase [Gemmatimonadaceae bacterium]|nr:alpha/beta fold hydrolase [Gemmatimonadaceae bacterium]
MPTSREPIPPPRTSGFTRSTEVPLYWCAYGPAGARRLLVLHGGPGAHHDYLLPQFLDLADAWELVFYDQRGGGRSKADGPAVITGETHVRDLALVIAELGLEPPAMIGYSWGAMLALLYAVAASRDRALVSPSHLSLIDPAPLTRAFRGQFETEFARRQASPAVRRLRDELATSGLRLTDPAAYRQRAFELSVAGYFAHPGRARDLTPFRVMGRVQQSVWESLGDFNLIADLGAVHCPTVIVHGREDPVPLASSQAASHAMHAELVVLDGCGHVPYVEARSELFSVLRSFLQRHPDSVTS